ncbi:MAG: putative methylmalonate-semialdehyde dehydrogenase [acylating] (mmsdh), partial [Actinomycetia bacterium]|nr:putative methylmalonate-semialdehyde dehydrogenase [acylating] (mmsdh) [Actinomycetes bacterium]
MSATAQALVTGPFVQDGVLVNCIGGEWTAGSGSDRAENLDPATGEPLIQTVQSTPADATAALAAAAATQPGWAATSIYERAEIFRRAAGIIRARAHELAMTLTLEEGKPLREAVGEVVRTAETLEVYAGLVYGPVGEVLGGHKPASQWTFTDTVPLGVVVAITPWNFPMLLPGAKVAAALITGNTVVLKPADPAPMTMAAFVAILAEAGVHPGAVNLILGRGSVLGPALLQAPAAAVTFTGGNVAGKVIAAAAVDAGMKYQLELGGNNPVLVLADADLDLVDQELTAGAVGSTGQKCTATRRVFVVDECFDEVSRRLQESFASKRLGPGIDPETHVGPLVTAQARDEFEESVADAEAHGATVRRFGEVPAEGFYGAPTILLEPDPQADHVRRETFGPMVSLMRVKDYAEGIERCNDTEFGLSASIFSRDIKTAIAFANDIQAGMVHINSQTTGAEPNMPFGGMKASSSWSREMGQHGLDWYTQLKAIY